MKTCFENPAGYSICEDVEKSTWWTTIYEYTAREKALTFVNKHGTRYQPDRHFFTDQGSIPRFPPFIRMLIPKDRFLGFYLHDSAYMDKGLWIDGRFTPMTRKQVDDLLYDMILADPIPGSKATAGLVWSHVRMYGWTAGWGKGDAGKPKGSIDPLGGGGILQLA